MQWPCTRASSTIAMTVAANLLSVIVVAWVQCLNIIMSMLHVNYQYNICSIFCTYSKIKSLIGYFWIKCAFAANVIIDAHILDCSNAVNECMHCASSLCNVHSTRKVHIEQFQCQWAIFCICSAHFSSNIILCQITFGTFDGYICAFMHHHALCNGWGVFSFYI